MRGYFKVQLRPLVSAGDLAGQISSRHRTLSGSVSLLAEQSSLFFYEQGDVDDVERALRLAHDRAQEASQESIGRLVYVSTFRMHANVSQAARRVGRQVFEIGTGERAR